MQPDMDKLIDSVLASQSIGEVKAATTALAVAARDADDIRAWVLCQQLANRFLKWARPYSKAANRAVWNAVMSRPNTRQLYYCPPASRLAAPRMK